MTLWAGPLLPLAALVWPLLLAALAGLPWFRPHAIRLLPLAPLPALWLAIAGEAGTTEAPDLLLGVSLGLDPGRQLLLGMTALLWTVAGLAAQPMAGRPNTGLFAGFWSLTLAGNLGVFLALDVVTFYVAFAAVSLAAWFLVVHDRSEKALQAGRIYIVIALAGEVALLLGLVIGADSAGSLAIDAVRRALGGHPVAIALLVAGFGIKAGLVPLHVWLPLAHPAAPVPASAVLSGAIVKAGVFAMILFLPEGAAGHVLMTLGLAGAFGAALWGLTQANPKAVLAYSTISQMGLMIMLVGAGGTARETVPYFALHHGLAKGALFLLVGVMMAAQGRGQRRLCLALAAAVAASVAGVPLTGGALAKTAVKQDLANWAALSLSVSSVGTSLILVWFLARLRDVESSAIPAAWGLRLLLPASLAVAAVVAPWMLWQGWTDLGPDYPLKPETLTSALWPVALALPAALALLRWPVPPRPPGDLLLLLRVPQPPDLALPEVLPLRPDTRLAARALRRITERLEGALTRWSLTGLLVPLLALALFATLE